MAENFPFINNTLENVVDEGGFVGLIFGSLRGFEGFLAAERVVERVSGPDLGSERAADHLSDHDLGSERAADHLSGPDFLRLSAFWAQGKPCEPFLND